MKNHIDNCIVSSITGTTKLNDKARTLEGMSSFKVRNFLNRLLEMPNSKYLEIGVWKGSTFYSALYKNKPQYAVAIDNWSEFNGPKEDFAQTVKSLETQFEFFCGDCFKIDKALFKSRFNIYFYDGCHSEIAQEMALTYYYDALENEFIFICDDWNAPEAQTGTKKGIEKTGLKILNEWVLPARFNGDKENWWNGLYIIHASK